jgi:hypothetical protein
MIVFLFHYDLVKFCAGAFGLMKKVFVTVKVAFKEPGRLFISRHRIEQSI